MSDKTINVRELVDRMEAAPESASSADVVALVKQCRRLTYLLEAVQDSRGPVVGFFFGDPNTMFNGDRLLLSATAPGMEFSDVEDLAKLAGHAFIRTCLARGEE